MEAGWVRGIAVGLLGCAAAAAMAASDGSERKDGAAEARLEQAVDSAMKEDGPFLTPEEEALIERKCGYPPGSRDSKSLSMSDGVLHCSNGRRVDDPEVRAMMAVAGPRIETRVKAIMARPEIKRAIAMVADEATAEALRELAEKWGK
jgi:hypothetical protein